MILLDGKKILAEIKAELTEKVNTFVLSGRRAPCLVAVLVGDDGASQTYVSSKEKNSADCGFTSRIIRFDATVSEAELLKQINILNDDNTVDGFIVQSPLPLHISEQLVFDSIHPMKDVDGFNTINTGRLTKGMDCFVPATPMGIMELLKRYNIETSGKNCVVIGRSDIVGRPMSILMSQSHNGANATVTLCHSKTQDLKEHTLCADIVIAALGKPEFLTADMVKENAVIIDVGITRVKDDSKKSGFRLAGDVKFDEVAPKCTYITPVPGGVGLMTIASLLQNTMKAYEMNLARTISINHA
jgi:methylenetetrahydrofolate dehydrogenase (NADP+)/methenyltetrahydrofolate cyclohydrolase